MAILWLLLLAFKDLEKSLLLSGREEEIIESYLFRGDKKMKFVIAIVVLLGISFVWLTQEPDTRLNAEKVTDYAKTLPRDGTDSGMYFLEKNAGIIGWNATVLVFGYPNNLAACNVILDAARATSPSIDFRCAVAN